MRDPYHPKAADNGFTVIEIMIVVVIISIAAMMAIPMIGSASSMRIHSAVNVIAADLEYAKSMAIGRQKIYSVIFDKTNETYRIEDPNGVIPHPVKKGFQYFVDFSSDNRLSGVDIFDVSFDTTSEVKFDYLGSPLNGNGNPLNSGVITLKAADITSTVTVEPVTGFVLITE
jgi:prepilin-type N-terminal cleavage/methylation domain-containing protein